MPQTPPPRKGHAGDKALKSAHKKIEEAMHLCVEMVENGNFTQMPLQVALMRSAWEDLLQSRRVVMAGNKSNLLDRRPDADAPESLTQE